MSVMTDNLLDMMADILVVQPISTDGEGDSSPSGPSFNLPCYIEGESLLVRGSDGVEVVSSIQVFVDPSNLTTHGHRYTLPSRFDPYQDLQALAVGKVSDESGPHHEVVMFK